MPGKRFTSDQIAFAPRQTVVTVSSLTQRILRGAIFAMKMACGAFYHAVVAAGLQASG